ncbi:MAG: GNAT family N-acetyltransferase [Bacteriovoracaceae bacterium]
MNISYRVATPEHFKSLAELRIEVFYDFPYLYQGSMEYEQKYLETYLKTPTSRIFLALDGERIVGASSCVPLEHESKEVIDPLIKAGFSPNDVLYFGESVLKKEYRGHGIGLKFFELRESYAKELSRKHCLFCAVIRDVNHPLKPRDYIPLTEFWKKRGYKPLNGCIAFFRWLDRDNTIETEKGLQFWSKELLRS